MKKFDSILQGIVPIFSLLLFVLSCSQENIQPKGDNIQPTGDDLEPVRVFLNTCNTIIAPSDAKVGDKYEINDVTYTVVDSTMLYNMIAKDEDVSIVITSLVTNMSGLLSITENYSFNQDISTWDVSNVTDMSYMFGRSNDWLTSGPENFNQDLSCWDVGSVTNMKGMFSGADAFNQDISCWDVSNVQNMSMMFRGSGYNQHIGTWDVSNVTNMSEMFKFSSFDMDIGSWDVSKVIDMSGMFEGCNSYGCWNSHNISAFNQDISSWDVSKVWNMEFMFSNAKKFNQDLASWNCSVVSNCRDFSEGATSWILPKPTLMNCDP